MSNYGNTTTYCPSLAWSVGSLWGFVIALINQPMPWLQNITLLASLIAALIAIWKAFTKKK